MSVFRVVAFSALVCVPVLFPAATTLAQPAAPAERCPDGDAVRAVLGSNDRSRVEALRDITREACPSVSRRAARWLDDRRWGVLLPPLPFGEPIQGVIQNTDAFLGEAPNRTHYDEYRLRLLPGDGVSITVQSNAFAPILAIGTGRLPNDFQQDGYAESADQDSTVLNFVAGPIEPSEEYTDYVVVVAGGDSRLGAYEVRVSSYTPPPPRPIQLNESVQGEFVAGTMHDAWSFQVQAGQMVRISMESDAFDSYLTLGMWERGQSSNWRRTTMAAKA